MFLTHNQPFLNFDQHIDVDGLIAMKPFLSAFIARNHHLLKPTKYVGGNFAKNQLGVGDFQQAFLNNPHIVSDQKLRTILTDLVNCDQFGNYVVFEEDVVTGIFSIIPRYCKNYLTKHLFSECVALSEDSQLDFFYQWLDRQDIFSEYGRVTFFVNYTGSSTPMHTDYPNANQANTDEFILFGISPSKQLFLFDTQTNQKIYLTGYCNWFNTNNYHGTEPVEKACYSIRVDGIFSDTFRQRALHSSLS